MYMHVCMCIGTHADMFLYMCIDMYIGMLLYIDMLRSSIGMPLQVLGHAVWATRHRL